MQADRIQPMLGIGKELRIQFVLGYEPHEFAAALDAIADGRVDLAPLAHRHRRRSTASRRRSPTSAIPSAHAKILVEP